MFGVRLVLINGFQQRRELTHYEEERSNLFIIAWPATRTECDWAGPMPDLQSPIVSKRGGKSLEESDFQRIRRLLISARPMVILSRRRLIPGCASLDSQGCEDLFPILVEQSELLAGRSYGRTSAEPRIDSLLIFSRHCITRL
jgi:hypothetical protein